MKLLRKMNKWLMSCLLAGMALGVTTPAAHAQSQSELVRNYGEWVSEFQRVTATVVEPLQKIPEPPGEDMSRGDRRAWAANARAWAENARSTYAVARADLVRLPDAPSINAPEFREMAQAVAGTRPRLSETIIAGEEIADAHLQLADVFERGNRTDVRGFRVRSIDAALLTMRLFQDINTAQSAAVPPNHPQRWLLLAMANSYEAIWALLHYKRGLIAGEEPEAAGAASAIEAAMGSMRARIRAGRTDAVAMQASLARPEVVRQTEPALLARVRAMIETYDASFNREERIAAEFEAIAALLRDPRGIAETEAEIDRRAEIAGSLDFERVADNEQRTRLLTQP